MHPHKSWYTNKSNKKRNKNQHSLFHKGHWLQISFSWFSSTSLYSWSVPVKHIHPHEYKASPGLRGKTITQPYVVHRRELCYKATLGKYTHMRGEDWIGQDRTRQDNTTKRMNESIHKKFRYFNKVWLKTRTNTIQEDIRRLQTDVHRMESCSVSGNEKRTNRQSHSWVPPTLCWPGRWLAVVVQNQEIWKHSCVNMVNGIWDYSQCHAGEYNFKDFSGNIVGILGKSRTLCRL